ncbi:pentapeptide repeat-containing protein [Capnocytophaga sp.]|uniref:pentapeptide repeat-containing protein n=1 Tax=Capnocytophaga sp. TaxID=44737 RepID=UPI0026DC6EC1|nr:pentapeptide repeat-containing protein [Capnocytophaga sp.]MDO5105100.1 hypothetical protein [Capnocytophaga sp.]
MNSDLDKYIQKIEKNPETGKDEVWLHNLPEDETLFDILNFPTKWDGSKSGFYNLANRVNFFNHTFVFTENIKFRGEINNPVNFSNCIFKETVDFSDCIFKEKVNFSKVKFEKEVFFIDSIFKKGGDFKQSHFSLTARFWNAKFFYVANFENTHFFSSVYFMKTHFQHSAKFRKVKFSSLACFIEAQFYSEANFNHSKFENIIDFSAVIFKKEILFYNISFLDKAIFSNAIFEQEAQFLYCKASSNIFITFEGATFKKCLDISRSNFHYCNLRFWNMKIEGDENLSQYEKYINDFNNNKVEPSVYAKIRESYRIIKNSFYKEDNRIEGLEFYKKEMDVYREELKMKRKEIRESYNPSHPSSNKIWLKIKNITRFLNNTIHKSLFVFHYIMSTLDKSLNFLSNMRQKKDIGYHFIFFTVLLLLAGLYIFLKNHYFFWGLIVLFTIWTHIEFYINRKNIKNPIKENNFIPIIILLFCIFLIFSPLYSKVPYNNDCIFKAFTLTKIQIEQFYELLLHNDDDFFSMIIVIFMIFFAILMVIIFQEKDRVLLWFNKNSNDFGTNWMVGVNFTFIVGLITYLLILIPISHKLKPNFEPEGIGLFLRYYGELLNPLKWNDIKPFEQELGSWQYIIAFIGRIFIGYGYYQTIQAFRKYGKSS